MIQTSPSASRSSPWSQEQRLEFIDFRLYWEGRVNRGDIMSFFGVSTPQASLDLARYIEIAPQNIEYNKKLKAYFSTSSFKPVLTAPHAQGYLNQLLGVMTHTLQKEAAFIGEYPAMDVVQPVYRDVPTPVLRAVLKAIHQKLSLTIEYQSLTRPEPTQRDICPHAISFDGRRWHIRAYCLLRNRFQDFLFSRILHFQEQGAAAIELPVDHEWHTMVEIKIAPHPDLSEGQQNIIKSDFGMSNGIATVHTRLALLRYNLRFLRIYPGKATSDEIVLANAEELMPYLAEKERAG